MVVKFGAFVHNPVSSFVIMLIESSIATDNVNRAREQKLYKFSEMQVKKRGLTGKDPRGLAAAALYMACNQNGEKKIQKDIAIVAGTTEVTLRNWLRGIMNVLN